MAIFLGSNAHVFNTNDLKLITDRLEAREYVVENALAGAVNTAAERAVALTKEEWNSYLPCDTEESGAEI